MHKSVLRQKPAVGCSWRHWRPRIRPVHSGPCIRNASNPASWRRAYGHRTVPPGIQLLCAAASWARLYRAGFDARTGCVRPFRRTARPEFFCVFIKRCNYRLFNFTRSMKFCSAVFYLFFQNKCNFPRRLLAGFYCTKSRKTSISCRNTNDALFSISRLL